MTENYRALIAILFLSVPALVYLRKPMTWSAIAPADYRLRAGLWVGLTSALFLVQSFWLFILIAALALLTIGRKDSNPLGLYVFLLFLAPPFQSSIDGFGGINRFLDIDYLRLLALTVLLPSALRMAGQPESVRLLRLPADKYLLGYLTLQLVSQALTTSTTDLLRWMLATFIDVFLPYYVFSRGLADLRRTRDVFASFAAVCAVMAVMALFEVAKGWLLYSSLPNFLNVTWNFGSYMMRDGSLRATVSTGHSIVFGYVMTVGLALYMALRPGDLGGRSWHAMAILLAAAVGASFSRGPWVGAAAMSAALVFMGPNRASRIGKVALVAVLGIPVLMLTPYASKIISLMPFIGAFDEGSVDYRQQLFTVSIDVLMQNPIFGSPYYMFNAAMEQMRQGEGIIDMVNSYLQVALSSGLVGLALFAGVFASSMIRLFAHLNRYEARDSEAHVTGRALLAALVGALVTIATASSINVIPVVYWCLAGACAAYLGLLLRQSEGTMQVPRAAPNRNNLGAAVS